MAATPRAPVDILERTINEVLINAGKLARAQTKQNPRLVNMGATKIAEENNSFNAVLDSVESDIIRAKSTLMRDLEVLRARKSAAAEAVSTAPQDGQQAPPAAMDGKEDQLDNATTAENGNAQAQAAGNMDLDPPATSSIHAAAAPTPSQVTQPSPVTANRDTFSQSPQWLMKSAPTQSPAIKTASPAAATTTSTAKATSPILIKSESTSPAVAKAPAPQPQPQPQTPGSSIAAAGSNASKPISLSASTSPSVKTVSPVLARKNASPVATRTPTTTAAPATAAPPTAAASEAPAAPAGVSTSMAMDEDLFGLAGPSSSAGPGHADLGFTDKQFSLVPDEQIQAKPEQEQQPQQQQPQQQNQHPSQGLPPQQAEAQMQPPPAPPQQHSAEVEFDVEKFAADAAQNLGTDLAFPSAPAAPSSNAPNKDGQTQQQPQAGTGPDAAGALEGLVGNDDDLYKYIDGMDALGDGSTSFDELYGTADVDIDNFFD